MTIIARFLLYLARFFSLWKYRLVRMIVTALLILFALARISRLFRWHADFLDIRFISMYVIAFAVSYILECRKPLRQYPDK